MHKKLLLIIEKVKITASAQLCSEGGRETGGQGLSVISCSKSIDKLDGQTRRGINFSFV